jgi:hypothetical protein
MVSPYSSLRDSVWFDQGFINSGMGTLAIVCVTTTAVTVEYIEDLYKPEAARPCTSHNRKCP